ncbi:hypothetical protein [Vibrio harveyi]|uniref:hypothetical protein n=1 Tax=Vibrio harveyi TaxID=669 RepID=UPI003C74F972
MTKEELYLIAKLTRANTVSQAFLSAEDVLINGLTQTEARYKHHVSKSTVSDAVRRYLDAYNEVCTVFKRDKPLDGTSLDAYCQSEKIKKSRRDMLKNIFYVHPNSNRVTSEEYGLTVHGGIVYITIIGLSLWNSDEARDLILNEIIRKDLNLVSLSKVRVLVSLDKLTQRRTLQFDLFWSDKGIARTDFEQKEVPAQELLDIISKSLY